ncbi:MAG: deoxyribodipyrimidine photo-lyase [Verrucomicrobiota bacterium]
MTRIVWFKRDLRIEDHGPLAEAAGQGSVIPLYVFEPDLWKQPDFSYRHYKFLKECLKELDESLNRRFGIKLLIRVGSVIEVFSELHATTPIESVWSHQETGNRWTYQRDKAVANWLQSRDIPWHERRQFGVVRRLTNRDGWSRQWNRLMTQPLICAPKQITGPQSKSDTLPEPGSLGLFAAPEETIQTGGRQAGLKLLESFLNERGEPYTKAMSSPVTAFENCSRLSTYISFGSLSIREIYHACKTRSDEIKSLPRGQKGKWPSALRSFSGRLRWHCHFMQKLEDEPRIEFENFHSAFEGIRPSEPDCSKLKAWQTGHTGFPMVDACMRALNTTGWINFRMRAMLMSFSSYHLWLDWRLPSLHLARMFTDYEPGIHYSQTQMQSGTTGINTVRAYNPIKQGLDHDPEGIFIRKWIPELADYNGKAIHQPWLTPEKLNSYPMPIVDEATARKAAVKKLYGARKNPGFRSEAEQIFKKHGSRRSSQREALRRPKASNKKDQEQKELSLNA